MLTASYAPAQDPAPEKKRGLFGLFSKKESPADPAGTAIPTASPVTAPGGSTRVSDGVERYPHIRGYDTKDSKGQREIELLIDRIYEEYERKIEGFNDDVLGRSSVGDLPDLPEDAISDWAASATKHIWANDRHIRQGVGDIYLRALAHSNQIRVFSDIPLIRETGMQEADGTFDYTVFGKGTYGHKDQPVGSALQTGQTTRPNPEAEAAQEEAEAAALAAGTAPPPEPDPLESSATRFIEDRSDIEFGIRKQTILGTQVSFTNRFNTLSNNSEFLFPDNQGGGEFVLSVVQPLLRGGGYHYNSAPIKVAKLDARAASAEFVRQVQTHLLEVSRTYWGLYYARSSFLLRKSNFNEAESILGKLEEREDLDAVRGELARSYAHAQKLKSALIRSEMAIKNAEERLRALVNDPLFGIGTGGEIIPTTLPVISRPIGGLKEIATQALYNRPEIDQGFAQMRAATVRRDVQRNELLPELNFIAEGGASGLETDNNILGAYGNSYGDGRPTWLLGLSFEMPIERNFAKARARRGEIELRQQANQLRTVIDTVLLEAIVTFREVSTAYRDIQGKYQSFLAAREELKKLEERMEADAADAEQGSQTTSYYLQLILDAQERLELAQDAVLEAVVIYNVSFASLERAKGTFLRYQGVSVDRILESGETHPGMELDKLLLQGRGANDGAASPK